MPAVVLVVEVVVPFDVVVAGVVDVVVSESNNFKNLCYVICASSNLFTSI